MCVSGLAGLDPAVRNEAWEGNMVVLSFLLLFLSC
jgi:hypothetical protein